MAAELGFEPRQTESESVVLPLHNSAINIKLLYTLSQQQYIIHIFFNLSIALAKFFNFFIN